jgi:hypothetical protein
MEYPDYETGEDSKTADSSLPRDFRVILAILESGHMVELQAAGYSMFPTLRPGDKVLVKMVKDDNLPEPGNIIVALRQDTLVLHRLTEIRIDGQGEYFYITRGDSSVLNDSPWQKSQVIGVANSYKRRKKERKLSRQVPTVSRRRLNRIVLWCWFKFKSLELRVERLKIY